METEPVVSFYQLYSNSKNKYRAYFLSKQLLLFFEGKFVDFLDMLKSGYVLFIASYFYSQVMAHSLRTNLAKRLSISAQQ